MKCTIMSSYYFINFFNIYDNATLSDFIQSDNSNVSSCCIKSRKCSSICYMCDGNVIVLLICIIIYKNEL